MLSRKLKSYYSNGMPLGLRTLSLGGSVAGLSSAADAIIRHVDKTAEEAQSPADVGRRQRTLSVAEERNVERGVGIRGGLMAMVRHKDPHFSFRLVVATTTVAGMVFTQIQSGKLAGAFETNGGASTNTSVCALLYGN